MYFYGILNTIVFFIALPFFYLERALHKKSFGWKEKFGFVKSFQTNDNVILLHACSVGEINAIENLAKAIRQNFPDNKFVITTSTKTGQDLAQKKFKNIADYVTYFPFDIPLSVNRFINNINPKYILIAETEIWPYFAYSARKKNIPVNIINGRISDSTYNLYKFAAPFFIQVFKNFSNVYTQSQEDLDKYVSIGMNKNHTEFMGNLKFDIIPKESDIDFGQDGYKIIIAGSTHHEENEIIIRVFEKLKKEIKNIKLLIAPRHLERVSEIDKLLKQYNLIYGFRSKDNTFANNDAIILDTLGELGKAYSICDIAFIGGSFNKTGGHNPLEASIYKKPVITGPDIHNFKDIYLILSKAKAGKIVNNEKELYSELNKLLTNQEYYNATSNNCKNIFEQNQGAVNFVIKKIKTTKI